MELNEPERKLNRFRIRWLFPALAVPASPTMLVALIAVVEIAAFGASPPIALGKDVVATPASKPLEKERRISPPNLKVCTPFVQLSESAQDTCCVMSLYCEVPP